MHRPNKSQAESMMVRCYDCDEIMYGIFSRKARATCSECGGQALNSQNPRYPKPPHVKGKPYHAA